MSNNEWNRKSREEGKETTAYITPQPQIYKDVCCGKRYFKKKNAAIAWDCQEPLGAFYFLS